MRKYLAEAGQVCLGSWFEGIQSIVMERSVSEPEAAGHIPSESGSREMYTELAFVLYIPSVT